MEVPTFWPGIHTPNEAFNESRSFSHLPRLNFTRGYVASDYRLISHIRREIQKGGALEVAGRGGDMVAYSRSDLDFVIKFPYKQDTLEPTGFSYRVAYGYSLAKENLGGILAPCIDVYGIFTDANGKEYGVMTLVQRKVKTAKEVIRELLAAGRMEEVSMLKHTFIGVNQQMWERGVFDSDTAWEENYGLLSNRNQVLIDIGGLLDDPNQFPLDEGVPRVHHYEAGFRDNFTTENFREFFGKNPRARKRSPNSLKSLESRTRAKPTHGEIQSMWDRDFERARQAERDLEQEDQDWN